MHVELAGGIAHVAAVPVEAEDNGRGRGGRRGWNSDEGFALDAVNGPVAESGFGGGGGEKSKQEEEHGGGGG